MGVGKHTNNEPISYHRTGCIAQAVKINLLSLVGKTQKKLIWAEATALQKIQNIQELKVMKQSLSGSHFNLNWIIRRHSAWISKKNPKFMQ